MASSHGIISWHHLMASSNLRHRLTASLGRSSLVHSTAGCVQWHLMGPCCGRLRPKPLSTPLLPFVFLQTRCTSQIWRDSCLPCRGVVASYAGANWSRQLLSRLLRACQRVVMWCTARRMATCVHTEPQTGASTGSIRYGLFLTSSQNGFAAVLFAESEWSST